MRRMIIRKLLVTALGLLAGVSLLIPAGWGVKALEQVQAWNARRAGLVSAGRLASGSDATSRSTPEQQRGGSFRAAASAALVPFAATITVNSAAQEVTQANPNGIANGNCTLGEAILSANT